MNKNQVLNHEELASAFQWIIKNSYPTHPMQKPNTIRMVVGRDKIDESECASNENIVSISESGVYFWFVPYSEPGAPEFARAKLNGLFDFMKVVVWPRVVGDWCAERLMLEQELTETEKATVEHYQVLQKRIQEITVSDIKRVLQHKPSMLGLFVAAQNNDVAKLKRYAEELPDGLEEIGRNHIQELVEAIVQKQSEKVTAQRRMLTYQLLYINIAIPMSKSGQYSDWQSPERSELNKQSFTQLKYLNRLAKRRYANEFMAFCLSKEMLEIADRPFPDVTNPGDRHSYYALVIEFVTKHLESAEYTA